MDNATASQPGDVSASSTPVETAAPASILADAQAAAAPATTQAATEPVEKPEFLPDKFWRDNKPDYESLAKSYQGLEQLLGKKAQAVLVPNEKSTPEEVAAFRKALNIPESPDEYVKSLKPEQLPAGVEFDENMAKAASAIAHKHNVPPAALRELAALQIGQVQAILQAGEQMAVAEVESARSELKQQYGDQYGEKIEMASRVAKSAGIDPSDRMWQSPNAIRLALWVADKLSSDKIVGPDALVSNTGRSAAKDIQTNPENPYYQRYKDGDPDVVDLVRRYIKEG